MTQFSPPKGLETSWFCAEDGAASLLYRSKRIFFQLGIFEEKNISSKNESSAAFSTEKDQKH
jgi:hypothetical protein